MKKESSRPSRSAPRKKRNRRRVFRLKKAISKIFKRRPKIPEKKAAVSKIAKSPAPELQKPDAPKPARAPGPSRLAPKAPAEKWEDLPFSYNHTKLTLLARDPFWAYSYWDFSEKTWNWIQDFRKRDSGTRPKMRIHNLDQKNYYDLDIRLEAKNWYVHLGAPDSSFEAELGLLDSTGKFHVIARSNRIRTPRNTPSEVIDENWEPENFEEIYRLSGGGKRGHGSEIFSFMTRH